MSYENQIEENKVKETFIGIGIGIGLDIFYFILNQIIFFSFSFLVFWNDKIEEFKRTGEDFVFLGLSISSILFWLIISIFIIWWYYSQKNRKFVVLGIGIAVFIPLLIFWLFNDI